MKASTKDQLVGAYHELKGKVSETIGNATNNPRLRDQGQTERVTGKIRKKVGQIKRVIGK